MFFRDLSQIINIFSAGGRLADSDHVELQDLGLESGGTIATILKLNPIYYIVTGYRDALIDKIAFWEHPSHRIFLGRDGSHFHSRRKPVQKMKVHFADVL